MLGKKKKQKKGSGDDSEVVTSKRQRTDKVKRNEQLSSVVNETVVDQVMAEMRANPRFNYTADGQLWHVGLFLDTAEIGGLSKKTRNDPDKGSIVECIANGRIKVLATPSLLAGNCLVIIPDDSTIETIGEFAILKHAKYLVAFVSDDAKDVYLQLRDDDEVIPITYDDLLDITGTGDNLYENITEFLSEHGVDWMLSDDGQIPDDFDVDHMDAGNAPVDVDDDFEDDPIDLAGDEDASASPDETVLMPQQPASAEAPREPEPASEPAPAPEPVMTQQQADVASVAQQAAGNDYGRAPRQQAPAEPSVAVSPAQMQMAMVSSFRSTDLDLEVSTARFDMQFGKLFDTCVGFSETPIEGAGYMGNVLTQRRHDANADLRRHHRDNMERLRTKYIMACSRAVVGIENNLSLTEGDNEYARRRREIDDEVQRQRASIDTLVNRQRQMLERQYEEEVERWGERVKAEAMSNYREHHGQEHMRSVAQLPRGIENDIALAKDDAMAQMLEDRRHEAQLMFEHAESKIMEDIAVEYAKLVEDEDALFQKHRSELADLIDENRKEDIAYSRTLQESLAREDKVAAVRAEMNAEIARIRAQAQADREHLEQQLRDAEAQRKRERDALEQNHRLQIERMNADLGSSRDQQTRLMEQLDHARDDAKADAAAQLATLEKRLDDAKEQMELSDRAHRRMIIMVVAVAIVLLVAGVCIGLVFGMQNGATLMREFTGAALLGL